MVQDAPWKKDMGDSKKLLDRRSLLALGRLPTWLNLPLLCPIVLAMCIYGPIRHSPAMMFTIFVAVAMPRKSFSESRMINLGQLGPPDAETLETFSKRARWHLQRRRLYVKWAADRVDKELHCAWRSVLPSSPRQEIARAVGGESRSLLCYHAAASSGPAFVGFLLPPEVVSCSYLPEPGLRAHCVRLLREQWESEARHLAVIPEDGSDGACVLGEDKLQESQEEGGRSTWGWRSNVDSTSSLEVQACAEVY